MLFNSLQFLLFFPVVTILYFVTPHSWRWLLLLAASCVFYMAFIPSYILILLATIVVDYTAGIIIEKTEGAKRKLALIGSIVSTCLILIVFRYLDFFTSISNDLGKFFGWSSIPLLGIAIPIGLSFHTFQSLSYVIEVSRGRQKAEYHFGIYALYVMFYPQLMAGPIERPQNLLHQFREKHSFDYHRIAMGLQLMLWGFFKKIVVADRLALCVNPVFKDPHAFSGFSYVLAAIFFTIQIYCDFSGYTDVARGAAEVMGFRLMKNFDNPYSSASFSEFWRRWHISLSTWFRDYIYIPLGGSRVHKSRMYFNILVTFGLSGLWHGASWKFMIWGILNGLFLIAEDATKRMRGRLLILLGSSRSSPLYRFCSQMLTFSLISIAFLFFRANSPGDAFYMLSHFSLHAPHLLDSFLNLDSLSLSDKLSVRSLFFLRQGQVMFVHTLLFILLISVMQWMERFGSIREIVARRPLWQRWPLYFSLIFLLLFMRAVDSRQFIYFQF